MSSLRRSQLPLVVAAVAVAVLLGLWVAPEGRDDSHYWRGVLAATGIVLALGRAALSAGRLLDAARGPYLAALAFAATLGWYNYYQFDGKVFSGYFSSPKHTLPSLQLNHWETHEVGYLWDAKKMGQLRDYDRRAQGFWTGIVVEGELFGQSVPIVRGDDNRRSFWVDGSGYIETEPNCCATGDVITVGPRKLEVYEHDDPRRPLAPPNPHADEEGEEDED